MAGGIEFGKDQAARLRQAVQRRSYDEVVAALEDYRRHVDTALAAMPAEAPSRAEILRQSVELIAWALRAMKAARAHTAEELDRVSTAIRYHYTPPASPAFNVEG